MKYRIRETSNFKSLTSLFFLFCNIVIFGLHFQYRLYLFHLLENFLLL